MVTGLGRASTSPRGFRDELVSDASGPVKRDHGQLIAADHLAVSSRQRATPPAREGSDMFSPKDGRRPMVRRIDSVPVAKLLLDTENARLAEEQASQPDTMLALARLQGGRLVALAKDIVDNGMDPLNLLAVVATDGTSRRYRVLEGNRRALALKALETPSVVLPALQPTERKALLRLSARYQDNPVEEVNCILFDSEDDAQHWIKLRHTGLNQGAGLTEWDSNEKDRYDARHGGGSRSLGGQALDLLRELDGPRPADSPKIAVTTVTRLLGNATVRERLGLSLRQGQLLAHHPKDEVAKGLRRIIRDLEAPGFKVGDVYTREQREQYASKLPPEDIPEPSTRLSDAYPFEDLPETSATNPKPPAPRTPPKRKPRPAPPRTTLVRNGNTISPSAPRLNAIYVELTQLDVTTFTNAASVTFRVLIELSMDDYLTRYAVGTQQERDNDSLAQKLKKVASHLENAGRINRDLKRAVVQIADNDRSGLAASVFTFHQYVHNQHVYPRSADLCPTWDQLEPFLQQAWQ